MGDRITQWLLRHPFAHPVELCIVSVVMPVHPADPYSLARIRSPGRLWRQRMPKRS